MNFHNIAYELTDTDDENILAIDRDIAKL